MKNATQTAVPVDRWFCTDCTCKTDPTPGVCGVWVTGTMAGANLIFIFNPPFELVDPVSGVTIGKLGSKWKLSK